MKLKYFLSLFIISYLFTACVDEVVVNPDFKLSFVEQGQSAALAGVPFYVKPNGQAEFLTLYDGKPGAQWDSLDAKGVDFNQADSLPVTYTQAGTYYLTMVATSATNLGHDFTRKFKTIEIKVVDNRNEILEFKINDVKGIITATDSILFLYADNTTDFNFIPEFKLSSTDAKVFVGSVEQTSGFSSNNFVSPISYVVKSPNGDEKTYTVKINTFAASAEKQLLSFKLNDNDPSIGYSNSNGEVATIDENTKVINIALNYGTKSNAVAFTLTSSALSNVLVSNVAFNPTKKNYNLTTISSVKVVAQNASEQNYTLSLSTLDPVESFTFSGLVPAPIAIINKVAKTISIDVLAATNVTKLKAQWIGSVGTVKIGTVTQKNGETENDFSTPKVFTFYKGTTAGDKYTVSVNKK